MAFNLTSKLHLYLDRCYATTSKILGHGSTYDLFTGCARDPKTSILLNGEAPYARFSFRTFRFLEHSKLPLSTFYLQCVVRLCERSACQSLQNCSRTKSRRETKGEGLGGAITDPTTVTSVRILTRSQTGSPAGKLRHSAVALGAATGVLGLVCVGIMAFLIGWHLVRRRTQREAQRDPQ
uniref:zona pellucida-like domain-containing protein 1 n=1 Tax=Pristiophorus japonicus TaxID=55135 RepID=UPI00398E7D81